MLFIIVFGIVSFLVKRAAKTEKGQYQLFVDLLESSIELKTGFGTKETLDKKWKEVEDTLNSYGFGPKKSAEQWKEARIYVH